MINSQLTVGSMLTRTVERHPHREALVADGKRWTYRAWNGRINQAANGFAELGVRPFDRVLIFMSFRRGCRHQLHGLPETGRHRRAGQLPTIAGRTGAYLAGLGRTRHRVRCRARRRAQCRRWRGDEHITRIVVGAAPRNWAHDFDTLMTAASDEKPSMRALPEMISALVYTSGTTGRRQGRDPHPHQRRVDRHQLRARIPARRTKTARFTSRRSTTSAACRPTSCRTCWSAAPTSSCRRYNAG